MNVSFVNLRCNPFLRQTNKTISYYHFTKNMEIRLIKVVFF